MLVQRLGAKNVFQDVAAIGPGEDFTVAIDRALDACDALLAVIGPGWVSASTPDGPSRLQQRDDYVRLEVARALARDIPVVPVLVGGAQLPAASELPEDLRPLARRQAVVLREQTWHQDVDSLLRGLRGEPDEPTMGRRRAVVVAAAVAVPLIAIAVYWLPSRDGDTDGAPEEGLPICEAGRGAGWTPIDLGEPATRAVEVEGGTLTFGVEEGRWREVEPGKWRVILDATMLNGTPEHTSNGDWHYGALVVGRRAFERTCFSGAPYSVPPGTVGDARVGFDVRCPPEGYMVLADDLYTMSVTSENLEPSDC